MFEHHSEPIATRAIFLRRLGTSGAIGFAVIVVSLLVGMVGFRLSEKLSWVDAFLNAAMLLGGQGPVEHQRNTIGKLFEGVYAIYCGLAVISVAGIIFAPIVHRFLHKLHQQSIRGKSSG
jgi:hypothetical protein